MKICFVLMLFLHSLNSFSVESIQVYSPYVSAPYVVDMDKKKGLIFDFVDELNKTFKGKFVFSPNFVTRSRLKVIFAKKDDTIIVPFVTKAWFDDVADRNFLWTAKVSDDCNVIISRHDKNLKIKSWDDLRGLSTSLVNGEVNKNFQALIDQKKIHVEYANHLDLNFLKLKKGRVDFLVTGHLVADYFIINKGFSDLKILDPVDRFSRQILISSKINKESGIAIKNKMGLMIHEGKIQSLFDRYKLKSHPEICNKGILPSN